jgi:hypothetical protein
MTTGALRLVNVKRTRPDLFARMKDPSTKK